MTNGHVVWIINIGNELLLGTTINTNGSWLARKFSFLGFKVARIIVVPDECDDLASELFRALSEKVKIVITTGGLGPTQDDKTLECISEALKRPLELNNEAFQLISEFYKSKGLELTTHRIKMAYMPRGSTVLRNPIGAAPGAKITHEDTIIYTLPGVPSEMKAMFENHIEPELRSMVKNICIKEETIIIKNVPESALAPYLAKISKKHPYLYIKSHPKGHEHSKPLIHVQIWGRAKECEDALKGISDAIKELSKVAAMLQGELLWEGVEEKL